MLNVVGWSCPGGVSNNGRRFPRASATRSCGQSKPLFDDENSTMTSNNPARPIDPQVRIGHVHLKVADLERSIRFYCGVLGFELTQRYGTQAAFISAGGYHHHIGLNTWESLGGSPPPPRATGLYHVAFLYPTRKALAIALRRVVVAGIPLDGASDHGVSEALYLRDPDENGVELHWDRPKDLWPRTKPLSFRSSKCIYGCNP